MSVLRHLASPLEQRALSLPWNIGSDFGGSSSRAGITVNESSALGLSTVWSCVMLLADVVYALPVDVFRRQPDGTTVEVSPALIVSNPSSVLSAREWRAQAVVSMALYGNAYGLVLQGSSGGTAEMVDWLNPADVYVEQSSVSAKPTYHINGMEANPREIVHLRRYVKPGSVVGLAPLERQKETIGLALAAQQYAASWFGDGAHPSSILSTDAQIDEQQAKTVKERFISAIRGRREPAVLGAGWRYSPIQSSPQDSQLAELSGSLQLAVCQAFRIPSEMVGVAAQGSSLTYANREQRSIDFLTYTVDPWLAVLEDFWTTHIPRGQFARFNTGALVRSDLTTRYQAHETAIRAGLSTPNERRRLEDMPPMDGGDSLLWPPYRTSDQETP